MNILKTLLIGTLLACGAASASYNPNLIQSGAVVVTGGTINGTSIGQTTPAALNGNVTSTGSTTARSLPARGADEINVKDYGAKCDGSTDDAASFTLAEAVVAGTYAKLRVPASSGACMLGSNITLVAGLNLTCDLGATIKALAGNTSNPSLFNDGGNSNITVYGCTIDGGGATFSNANPAVTVFNATHVLFDHVHVQHVRGLGLNFSNVVDTGIVDSSFIDIGNFWKTSTVASDRLQGVSICCTGTLSPTKNYIERNYFEDIGLDAINVGSNADILIAHNRFNMSNNQRAIVTSSNYPAAVFASTGAQLTLVDNIADTPPGNCYDINSITTVIASGNYGIFCGGAGLEFNAIANLVANDNVMLNTHQWSAAVSQGGITFIGAMGSTTLNGNISTDNQGSKTQPYGVHGVAGSTFSVLSIGQDNLFGGNLTANFGGTVTGYSTFPIQAKNLCVGSSASDTTLACAAVATSAFYNYSSSANNGYYASNAGTWSIAVDNTTGQLSIIRATGSGPVKIGAGIGGAQMGNFTFPTTVGSAGQPLLSSGVSGTANTWGQTGAGAEQTISFQPGLITSITNTKGVFGKFVKASTVDNIEGSANVFSCVSNPTITLYECGTDVSCASPTTIGSATVTSAGTAVDGTISNAAIAAGHYVAWAVSAGTCTSLDIAATAQAHAN